LLLLILELQVILRQVERHFQRNLGAQKHLSNLRYHLIFVIVSFRSGVGYQFHIHQQLAVNFLADVKNTFRLMLNCLIHLSI